jgi:hypothetical protein
MDIAVVKTEIPASNILTLDKYNPTRPRPLKLTSKSVFFFVSFIISFTPLHTILAALVLLQKRTVARRRNFRFRTVSSRYGDPITKFNCCGMSAVLQKYNENIAK